MRYTPQHWRASEQGLYGKNMGGFYFVWGSKLRRLKDGPISRIEFYLQKMEGLLEALGILRRVVSAEMNPCYLLVSGIEMEPLKTLVSLKNYEVTNRAASKEKHR